VPVWPHEKFAEACATKAWSGYKPAPIKLRDWIDNWTPGMADDGRLVAVFPNLENNGAVVEPGRLKDDILGELDQIE
jgi:hypothetical protein